MDATGYLEQAFTIVGPDGRPMNSENGWAIKRSSYNDRGNITEQSYFDETGRPVVEKEEGCHIERSNYDKQDRFIGWTCINEKGEPWPAYGRGVTFQSILDEHGRTIAKMSIDADRNPMINDSGVVGERIEHDQFGNQIRRRLFDVYGKPTLSDS
jgi:hypothetical protein